MIVTFLSSLFINLLLVNFGMIGCLLTCIKFKQKPFKWLVFAGLLIPQSDSSSQVIDLKVHFLDIARHGGKGHIFSDFESALGLTLKNKLCS